MKRLLATALILATATPAFAAQPKLVSTHTDWTVHTRGTGQAKQCFALTRPKTKAPSSVQHGDIFFMVGNWASGAASEQPSLMTGYTLKPARAPKARVGSHVTTMYGADNEAFVAETADERTLVSKMRAGSTMTVEAVSSRGTEVSYSFSLKGVTAALREAKKLCA
jgi:hypothetical protein